MPRNIRTYQKLIKPSEEQLVDAVNEIIESVNTVSASAERENYKGKPGDVKVNKVANNKYDFYVRGEDGWHRDTNSSYGPVNDSQTQTDTQPVILSNGTIDNQYLGSSRILLNLDASTSITGVANPKIEITGNGTLSSTGKTTIDSAGDIELNADGGDLFIKDDTSELATINSSGLKINNISAADSDTDKFLVSDSGLVKYRTGAQILTDLGITADEILDWTADQGSNNIHASNFADITSTGTLDISGGTLTTSAAQKKSIVEGVAANTDIGAYEFRAQTFQSDATTLSGTAPFTVASTVKVANLNADKLDGADLVDEDNMASNSAVKVPTQQSVKAYVDSEITGLVDSAPGALDTLNELAAALNDDASFSTTVTNSIATKVGLTGNETVAGEKIFSSTLRVGDATEGIRLLNISSNIAGIYGVDTGGSAWNSIHIKADGEDGLFIEKDTNKVGIGTTSPGSTLHISDASSSGVTSLSLNNRVKVRGDGVVYWGSGAAHGTLSWDSGKALINSQGTNDLQISAGGNHTDHIYIDGGGSTNDGCVGIGTNSPDEKLHVVGDLKVVGNISSVSGGASIGDSAADTFRTTGHTYLATVGNNVGIGNTSPNHLLHVGDDVTATFGTAPDKAIQLSSSTNDHEIAYILYAGEGTNNIRSKYYVDDATKYVGWDSTHSTGWLGYEWKIAGTQKMVLNTSGNLGIGTASPSVKLHVDSGTSDTVAIFKSSDSTARIQIQDDDTTNHIVSNNSTLSLGANNTTHAGNLNIDSNGRVGVGVTDPDSKVEIIGEGDSSSTKSLEIKDSGGTNLFYVRDDGVVSVTHNYLFVQAGGIYSTYAIRARGGITDDGGALGLGSDGSTNHFIITSGNITTGVWNGTAIASAYLDADTAHLTTNQTFTGQKTFNKAFPQVQFTDDSNTDYVELGLSGDTYFHKTSDANINFGWRDNNNNELMTLDTGGQTLTIGEAPQTTYKLKIGDNGRMNMPQRGLEFENAHGYFSPLGDMFLPLYINVTQTDLIRFQPPLTWEYYNYAASAYVDDMSNVANLQNMLDGRRGTSYSVSNTKRKFRFVITRATSWADDHLFYIENTWSSIGSWSSSAAGGGSLTPTMVVERLDGSFDADDDTNNDWSTNAGITTDWHTTGIWNGFGMGMYYSTSMHNTETHIRITVTFPEYADASKEISIKNIGVMSSYSSQNTNQDAFVQDFNRNLTGNGSISIPTGDSYKINGTAVISATQLGTTVVASSLTSVGTIGTGVWQGTAIASAYLDSDTAHLSGNQTFTGVKTFGNYVNIETATDAILNFKATDDSWCYMQFLQNDGDRIAYIGTDGDQDRLILNATENGADEIEINTTTVDINANVKISGTLDMEDSNITDVGDIALDTISSDAGTSIGVTLGTDAGDDFNVGGGKLVVEGDTGNVGIGTASPSVKLDVEESSVSALIDIHQSASSTGTDSGIRFQKNSNLKGTVGYNAGTDTVNLNYGAFDNTHLNIDSSGNVGIGTTSPTEPLEVWSANSEAYHYPIVARNPYNSETNLDFGVGIKLQLDDGSESKWAGMIYEADSAYGNSGDLAFYIDGATNTSPRMKLQHEGDLNVTHTGWRGIVINNGSNTNGSHLELKNTERRFQVAVRSNGFDIRDVTASDTSRLSISSGGTFNFNNNNIINMGDVEVDKVLGAEANNVFTTYTTGGIASEAESGDTIAFNSVQNNVDFQVDGENTVNLFYVDASADKVGIGIAAPTTTLDVEGSVSYKHISLTADSDDLDVSDCTVVECTPSGTDRLGGLTGGVQGQVIHILKVDSGLGRLIIEHNEGTGNQDIFLSGAADVMLAARGGITLYCNGTSWFGLDK